MSRKGNPKPVNRRRVLLLVLALTTVQGYAVADGLHPPAALPYPTWYNNPYMPFAPASSREQPEPPLLPSRAGIVDLAYGVLAFAANDDGKVYAYNEWDGDWSSEPQVLDISALHPKAKPVRGLSLAKGPDGNVYLAVTAGSHCMFLYKNSGAGTDLELAPVAGIGEGCNQTFYPWLSSTSFKLTRVKDKWVAVVGYPSKHHYWSAYALIEGSPSPVQADISAAHVDSLSPSPDFSNLWIYNKKGFAKGGLPPRVLDRVCRFGQSGIWNHDDKQPFVGVYSAATVGKSLSAFFMGQENPNTFKDNYFVPGKIYIWQPNDLTEDRGGGNCDFPAGYDLRRIHHINAPKCTGHTQSCGPMGFSGHGSYLAFSPAYESKVYVYKVDEDYFKSGPLPVSEIDDTKIMVSVLGGDAENKTHLATMRCVKVFQGGSPQFYAFCDPADSCTDKECIKLWRLNQGCDKNYKENCWGEVWEFGKAKSRAVSSMF